MTTPLHLSLHPRTVPGSPLKLWKPSLAGDPLSLPAGLLPLGPTVLVPQTCLAQTTAPLSEETSMSLKCSSTPQTICTSMRCTLHTPPPPPWMTRTPPAMPQPTPSPAPRQSQSPTPTPTPSPSHRGHRLITLWDDYFRTHGHMSNPLYHSPTPRRRRKPKKPKQHKLTPEQRYHQELQTLMAQPTHGRMLTRQLLGQIMGSHQPRGSS